MKGKIAQKGKHHHVALLVETSHEFGREVLRGIRDYEKGIARHWAFYLQPDGMRQDAPRMGSWPCTGVIARLFSDAAAQMLLTSGLPLVCGCGWRTSTPRDSSECATRARSVPLGKRMT